MSGHDSNQGQYKKQPETFISCRVGLEFGQFEENLLTRLEDYSIGAGNHAEFMITPLASSRSVYKDKINDINLVPDLVIPSTTWETRVAVSISYKPNIGSQTDAVERFEALFDHALYLPTQLVTIDCPDLIESQSIIARVVNDRLKDHKSIRPLVLFRMRLGASSDYSQEEIRNLNIETHMGSTSPNSDDTNSIESGYSDHSSPRLQADHPTLGIKSGVFTDDWAKWNSMRQFLQPDPRIGVNLSISRDLDLESPHLQRWCGEPVRVISIDSDRFVSQPNCHGSTRLAGRVRDFVSDVMLANSLLTAIVIQAQPNRDTHSLLRYLSHMCTSFDVHNSDNLRVWNDTLLAPLQPLSNNLESRTYEIFESDRIKYIRYRQAMVKALDHIVMRQDSIKRSCFNIMVLGAGRGPLVDAMITAIHSLNSVKKFKIFALDKNNSSVQSLKYKLAHDWSRAPKNIHIVVVKADMRSWKPQDKADLIATELLGSFSDNELSPECIDGTWRFSTPDTVCIPQSYTSYLAPICSQKLYQDISQYPKDKGHDQIHVVRLSNIYTICEPQPLFSFEHFDLSEKRTNGANERHERLIFNVPIDSVCHGFAGYFSAQLFGDTYISTVPHFKTSCMDSWFPAFIPLEKPVHLAAGSELEVSFSRRESATHVWYEWAINRPETSRIYSYNGNYSAMSKHL